MAGYLLARLSSLVVTVILGCLLTFLLGYYGPGDPVQTILGETWTTPEQYVQIKHDLGLDRPALVQFGDYIANAAHGDLGHSWRRGRPVAQLILGGLAITLQLASVALILMAIMGVSLGALAALLHNGPWDRTVVVSSVLVHAVPPYVLAPVLLVIFSLNLGLLPIALGWSGLLTLSNVVPVLTLVLGPLVFVVRQVRNGILDALAEDYVRTARAKGLRERIVVIRHVFPNALAPALSQLGIILAALMIGTIFVENIFNIPGFGGLIFSAVLAQDFPLLMGTTIVAIALVSFANLATDLLLVALDPRVRLAR